MPRACDRDTCEKLHTCSRCGEAKACAEYYRRNSRSAKRDRRQERVTTCRSCVNAARTAYQRGLTPEQRKDGLLRWKFGITLADFNRLLAKQGGVCAICATSKPGGRGTWAVDHDHSCCPGAKSCGVCVRGLLCTACNTGIGLLGDDPNVMRRAAKYVEMQ